MFEHHRLVRRLLEAAGARRLMEIGADQAEHTRVLVEWVEGIGGRLDAVDTAVSQPLSALDADHDVLHVHDMDSFTALSRLPLPDALLIDGDHNYWTVRRELDLVADKAGDDPHPLTLLHDVGWPYDRRDMYYEADRVPDDQRHPSRRAAILLGQDELADDGVPGFNSGFDNAERRGGERNGVLTAVEDAVAAHGSLRLQVVPGFHGLAVVVDERLLAERPALAELVDHLADPLLVDLLDRLEDGRLRALQQLHQEAWDKAVAQARLDRLREAHDRAVDEVGVVSRRAAELEARVAALESELAAERTRLPDPRAFVRARLGR